MNTSKCITQKNTLAIYAHSLGKKFEECRTDKEYRNYEQDLIDFYLKIKTLRDMRKQAGIK